MGTPTRAVVDPELVDFVDAEVTAGHFTSAVDVIQPALQRAAGNRCTLGEANPYAASLEPEFPDDATIGPPETLSPSCWISILIGSKT